MEIYDWKEVEVYGRYVLSIQFSISLKQLEEQSLLFKKSKTLW